MVRADGIDQLAVRHRPFIPAWSHMSGFPGYGIVYRKGNRRGEIVYMSAKAERDIMLQAYPFVWDDNLWVGA